MSFYKKPSDDDLQLLNQLYQARRFLQHQERDMKNQLMEPVKTQIDDIDARVFKLYGNRLKHVTKQIQALKRQFRMSVDWGLFEKAIGEK